ncbi:MAG: sigma-70 family RNA polymerase sigma factor [Candidatus Melainabacteria bacterium]
MAQNAPSGKKLTPGNSGRGGRKGSNEDIFGPVLDELLAQYLSEDTQSAERDAVRDAIVKLVSPFVKRIAYGLARRSSDPVEDLIQVGNIGLIKAVEKFNPTVGSSFKTYATYFITGEIRHYLRDKTAMIKAPRQMYELYYRINQIIQQLTDQLGRTPTDVEIAEALACPVHEVAQAQDIERRRTPISLDQFLVSEGGNETVYLEKLVDEKYFERTENRENKLVLENAIGHLKPELRDVIRMTYYEDMSQTQIAEQLGISQMQVSRRLRKALELLNKRLSHSELRG